MSVKFYDETVSLNLPLGCGLKSEWKGGNDYKRTDRHSGNKALLQLLATTLAKLPRPQKFLNKCQAILCVDVKVRVMLVF
jgi:hypothetical protein